MMYDNSVNKEKFMEFASALRLKYAGDKICLYFDLLAVHRSFDVR